MRELCDDLLAEYRVLADDVAVFDATDWQRSTGFFGWTPRDEVAHLCYFDEAGLLAVRDRAAFKTHARELMRAMRAGEQISALARERYAGLDESALVARWRERFAELVEQLGAMAARDRLPWYGPDMSARSFATARLMETWAHGQDIYDALGWRRTATSRLRHIAHLGATTFGWTFANRGLPVPAPAPFVELAAPEGSVWRWNDPSSVDFVSGRAEDFCLVVTQRRNVADTALRHGGTGSAWLAIAQCFAGPPADPPSPGARICAA